jgi:transcriptional regulator with XRE-family HTH domain
LPSSVFTPRHQEFIQFLVTARKAANVTQVELAARLGRPQSFVSKYERGERRLDVVEFCQIAEALGHEPARLLQEFHAGARTGPP